MKEVIIQKQIELRIVSQEEWIYWWGKANLKFERRF